MLTACSESTNDPGEAEGRTRAEEDNVNSRTNGGESRYEIKIKLFPAIAPIAVQNFVDLAESGYYKDKIFHRIIANFMIQGGSPFGDGMSDPEYDAYFGIEPHANAVHSYGALSMANAGPQRNSQQFFIVNNKNGTPHLNGDYTVFGHTIEGFEGIDYISALQTGAGDRPFADVIIEDVTIYNSDAQDDSAEGNVNGVTLNEQEDLYAVIKVLVVE